MSDRQLLQALIDDERLASYERTAFEDMLENVVDRWPLTETQRDWAEAVVKRLEIDVAELIPYSSGKIATGRPVATPAVLKKLPKRPPRKR